MRDEHSDVDSTVGGVSDRIVNVWPEAIDGFHVESCRDVVHDGDADRMLSRADDFLDGCQVVFSTFRVEWGGRALKQRTNSNALYWTHRNEELSLFSIQI